MNYTQLDKTLRNEIRNAEMRKKSQTSAKEKKYFEYYVQYLSDFLSNKISHREVANLSSLKSDPLDDSKEAACINAAKFIIKDVLKEEDMRVVEYKSFFKESDMYGIGGFLSSENYDDIKLKYGFDEDDIIMAVNMKLLNLADKGDILGKTLNKLNDIRVNGRKYHNKLAITLPIEITKKPKLVKLYNDIIKDTISKFKKK